MTNRSDLALSTALSTPAAGPNAVELGLIAPPQTAGPSDLKVLAHLNTLATADGDEERYLIAPAAAIRTVWPDFDVQAFYGRMAASLTADWRVVGRGGLARRRFYFLKEVRIVLDDDTAGSTASDKSATPSMEEVRQAAASAASALSPVPGAVYGGGTLSLDVDEAALYALLRFHHPAYRRPGDWSAESAQVWSTGDIQSTLSDLPANIVQEMLGRFLKEGVVVRKDDGFCLAVDPTSVNTCWRFGERPIYRVSHATAKRIADARALVAAAMRRHGGSIPAAELPALYRKVGQAWRETAYYVGTLLASDQRVRAARSVYEMLSHQPDGSAILVSPHLGWCDILVEDEGRNPDVRNGQSVRITTTTKGYGSASRRIFDRYRF